MTFVNQIAEIVHGVVDECWGAVNKNDGHLAVKKTNDVFHIQLLFQKIEQLECVPH